MAREWQCDLNINSHYQHNNFWIKIICSCHENTVPIIYENAWCYNAFIESTVVYLSAFLRTFIAFHSGIPILESYLEKI